MSCEHEKQLEELKQWVNRAEADLLSLKTLIFALIGEKEPEKTHGQMPVEVKAKTLGPAQEDHGSRVIEGVFDGLHMVGPDGKRYDIPPNYASKSKLVEGDVLKLAISPEGSFLYKQIGPIERDRLVGILRKDGDKEEYVVMASGKDYHVLRASVTYFQGEPGDETVILVPKGGISDWAAVENILKKNSSQAEPILISTPIEPSLLLEKGHFDNPEEQPQILQAPEETSTPKESPEKKEEAQTKAPWDDLELVGSE